MSNSILSVQDVYKIYPAGSLKKTSSKLQPQKVSTFEDCNSVRISGHSNKSVSQETEVKISGDISDADFKPSNKFREKEQKANELDVHALDGVSCEIEKGEFTAIAGPSGSGKTTLLNLIGCLDSISKGKIIVDGADISVMNNKEKTIVRREKIGFIFQSYNLIPVLTAQENVEMALQLLNKYSKAECSERAFSILKEVGLDGKQDRLPMQLSGGQQQRISIARALVKEPAVILADEPTANLDSKNSKMILDLMSELNQKHNITCLFSTHDQLVMQTVRRIIHIRDGRIES